jgi:hypothetical protein
MICEYFQLIITMNKNTFKISLTLVIALSSLFLANCSKEDETPAPPITIGFEASNTFGTVNASIKPDLLNAIPTDTLNLSGTNKYTISIAAYAVNGIAQAPSSLRRALEGRVDTLSVSDFTATSWSTVYTYGYKDRYTGLGYTLTDSLRYQGTVYPSSTYIVKIVDYSSPQLTKFRKLLIKRIQ